MSCGLPVVATRSGGPEEIVRHLENGVLVDACSPKTLAEQIVDIQKNEVLKSKMVSRAIDSIEKKYSSMTTLDSYDVLYKNSLKKP
jgi:glycosyltransferase involved in cell wall biosynthesis